MEMRKLSTIQKREKLNTVFAADEPGVGNANHKYVVVCGDESVGIAFQNGPRKDHFEKAKRKSSLLRAFLVCRWWELSNRPAVTLSAFQSVIKLCTLHYNKNRNTPRFSRSITVLVSADGGT